MKSRQQATAERPPAKRRGPKPSISDEALLVAIEADLEASPWEGEGTPQGLGSASGLSWHPCFPQAGAPGDAREQPALAPSLPPPWRNPHVGEIITHAPNLMWGTDGVRVFTVDDGWGWIFTAIEHWNAECVGWHVCKRGDRFAAFSRSPWGLRGCMPRPPPVRRGAGLADGSRLPVSVGPLHQPDQVLGHPAVYAFVEQPRPTASPRGSIARSRNRSSMAASTATSRSCGTPSAGSSNSTMPSGSWKRTAT